MSHEKEVVWDDEHVVTYQTGETVAFYVKDYGAPKEPIPWQLTNRALGRDANLVANPSGICPTVEEAQAAMTKELEARGFRFRR